jgi:hypothetical protein
MAKEKDEGTNGVAPGSKTDRRTFDSAEAAREAGPKEGNEKWGLWSVTGPDGSARYLFAASYGMALTRGAETFGLTAVNLDRPAKAVSKEAGVAWLASLPEDERKAVLAQFKGGRK